MPIQFTCTCGKLYQVSETLAGRSVKCKRCGGPLIVPSPPAAQTFNQLRPVPEQTGEYLASNPGILSPNYLKVMTTFPAWPAIIFGLLLISFGGVFISLWFLLPFAGMLALAIYYLRQISFHYTGGCITPARILSVEPPLVAVYTDLSVSGRSCHIIRLLRQPLHKLAPHAAKPGPISTISLYCGLHQELGDHWCDIHPVITNLATNDANEIQRVHSSIGQEEWQWLDWGLKQIPFSQPITQEQLRPYRIFNPSFQPKIAVQSIPQLQGLAKKFFSHDECKGCYTNEDLELETFQTFQKNFGTPIARDQVLYFVGHYYEGSGVLILPSGFMAYSKPTGPFTLNWNQIKGAYATLELFEIVLIDGQRIVMPCSSFQRVATQMQLEKFINRVVGLGSED
ncbi:MAG: DUF3239 domain-containing protein [Mariniblastus sp.]